jgi:hypothetical protein
VPADLLVAPRQGGLFDFSSIDPIDRLAVAHYLLIGAVVQIALAVRRLTLRDGQRVARLAGMGLPDVLLRQ